MRRTDCGDLKTWLGSVLCCIALQMVTDADCVTHNHVVRSFQGVSCLHERPPLPPLSLPVLFN